MMYVLGYHIHLLQLLLVISVWIKFKSIEKTVKFGYNVLGYYIHSLIT